MVVNQPRRLERTAVLELKSPAEDVFPLFCPVRETEWVDGWDPDVVYSDSGLVETDCVFETCQDGRRATWIVPEHDGKQHRVTLVKTVPGVVVTVLRVRVEDAADGCRARVSYSHTALSEAGDRLLADFTEEAYAAMMRRWESDLTVLLESTGTGIASGRASL